MTNDPVYLERRWGILYKAVGIRFIKCDGSFRNSENRTNKRGQSTQ